MFSVFADIHRKTTPDKIYRKSVNTENPNYVFLQFVIQKQYQENVIECQERNSVTWNKLNERTACARKTPAAHQFNTTETGSRNDFRNPKTDYYAAMMIVMTPQTFPSGEDVTNWNEAFL